MICPKGFRVADMNLIKVAVETRSRHSEEILDFWK